jgi:hypothetical protein
LAWIDSRGGGETNELLFGVGNGGVLLEIMKG